MIRDLSGLVRRRPWRIGALLATVAFVTASQRPEASAEALNPPAEGRVELRGLEERMARLEARLGITPLTERAGDFRDRYAALVLRERAVAARADSVLSFVPSLNPVSGAAVASGYGVRLHPVLRRVRAHHGVDLAAPSGTPVQATAAGRVASVFRTPEYGLGLDIDHGPNGFVTRYAHLSAALVREGASVEQGEVIGRVGTTGLTSGPTLHYEVYYKARARDPGIFLPATTSVRVPAEE